MTRLEKVADKMYVLEDNNIHQNNCIHLTDDKLLDAYVEIQKELIRTGRI